MTLLFGLAALVVILWSLNKIAKANPKGLAIGLRLAGGAAALAAAAFLALRGELAVAVPLGAMGLGLLGWLPWSAAGFGSRTQKSSGQRSQVRSAFLDMELDHDTGALSGQVTAGRHAGANLDTLDLAALKEMLNEIDGDSRTLLAAYLDRRHPGWREDTDAGAAAGQRGAARSGKMTEEEAYQILGIAPGASAEDVSRAHRLLMKKIHPDQGGSTYLAARVNEAKDVLLRRHR